MSAHNYNDRPRCGKEMPIQYPNLGSNPEWFKNGNIWKELKPRKNEIVIQKLLNINGIGLSTTTKILHTLYPKIIPMIDSLLQKKYREAVDDEWTEKRADEIFIDFYNNLKIESNRKNLNYIFDKISKNNLKSLSRIRIFDILWWSYLKAEKLRGEIGINWNTIRY